VAFIPAVYFLEWMYYSGGLYVHPQRRQSRFGCGARLGCSGRFG